MDEGGGPGGGVRDGIDVVVVVSALRVVALLWTSVVIFEKDDVVSEGEGAAVPSVVETTTVVRFPLLVLFPVVVGVSSPVVAVAVSELVVLTLMLELLAVVVSVAVRVCDDVSGMTIVVAVSVAVGVGDAVAVAVVVAVIDNVVVGVDVNDVVGVVVIVDVIVAVLVEVAVVVAVDEAVLVAVAVVVAVDEAVPVAVAVVVAVVVLVSVALLVVAVPFPSDVSLLSAKKKEGARRKRREWWLGTVASIPRSSGPRSPSCWSLLLLPSGGTGRRCFSQSVATSGAESTAPSPSPPRVYGGATASGRSIPTAARR